MSSIYTKDFDSMGENPWEGGAYSKPLPRGNDLGATLYELRPGTTGGNYHFHHGVEEMLIVICGQATLRTPEGKRRLENGEVVHFIKGFGGAHQVLNESGEIVRYVMVSTQASPDAVEYPDTGDLSVMARTISQLGKPLWDIRKMK